MPRICAVTFDFFHTLAHHTRQMARGLSLEEYFISQDLSADPIKPQTMRDLLAEFDERYQPDLAPPEVEKFWNSFTQHVFRHLHVWGIRADDVRQHARAIRRIFDVHELALYDDVLPALSGLRAHGLRLAVVANGQRGLVTVLEQLGARGLFDLVLTSAEVGQRLPQPLMFTVAEERLGLDPQQILHIGDRLATDIRGARAAGVACALLVRHGLPVPRGVRVIRCLTEVEGLVETGSPHPART